MEEILRRVRLQIEQSNRDIIRSIRFHDPSGMRETVVLRLIPADFIQNSVAARVKDVDCSDTIRDIIAVVVIRWLLVVAAEDALLLGFSQFELR